ncbi:hypothetical protein M5K25_022493 [Dendrobium thyrsiflorum]|uniref:Uncharacterized protein n=1 Tax=Dendrobium thyrsiflorum TaxID=117978 RepID=A0ABD0U677_DENTH
MGPQSSGRLEAVLQHNAAARASQILLPLLASLHLGQQRNAPICFAGFGGGAVLAHIAGVRKPAMVGAKPKLGDFSGMRLTKEIAAGAPGLSWLEEMIVPCVFLCEGKIEKKREQLAERSEKVAHFHVSRWRSGGIPAVVEEEFRLSPLLFFSSSPLALGPFSKRMRTLFIDFCEWHGSESTKDVGPIRGCMSEFCSIMLTCVEEVEKTHQGCRTYPRLFVRALLDDINLCGREVEIIHQGYLTYPRLYVKAPFDDVNLYGRGRENPLRIYDLSVVVCQSPAR